MKLVPLKYTLPVSNFDTPNELRRPKRHGDLLPNSIRGICVGPSNAGKTNAVFSLLIHPNGLRFENVYVCSKSLDQSKYQTLQKILEPIDGISFFGIRSVEDIPEKPLPYSVFIFDDLAGSSHTRVQQYFSYARHFKVDCFYIGQTYSRIPKQLLRDNANFLMVFKQDDKNLRHIYEDHVGVEPGWAKFKEMCAVCWKEPFGFLTIDKDGNNFRKGFDMIFKE